MPAPDYEDDLVFPPRHDKTAYELQLENNKLHGLLKECGEALSEFDINFFNSSYGNHYKNLLTRINTALGESEE